MSEKNMSDKFADAITTLIKKTSTFEKIETTLKGITIFMFITGITTLYNSYKLHKLIKCVKNMEVKINKKMDEIVKKTENVGLLVEQHKQSQNLVYARCIETVETTINSPVNNSNDLHMNNKETDEYYELLNECYDIMPCNNTKKATGLNLLFGWK